MTRIRMQTSIPVSFPTEAGVRSLNARDDSRTWDRHFRGCTYWSVPCDGELHTHPETGIHDDSERWHPVPANGDKVGKRQPSVSHALSSYTRTMRIAVGSDHAGFELKADLARHLVETGHEVFDFGTDTSAVSVDYPIYGIAVARAVAEGRAERGVCVCGTGVGISISANKVRGVRAALVHDATTAALARRHGDANVICLGGRTTVTAEAIDVVNTFVATAFEGGRHARRVAQISEYENSHAVFEVNGERDTTPSGPTEERSS